MSAVPKQPYFIVTAGTTRRLVQADNEGVAKHDFIAELPRRALLVGGFANEIFVREATDAEVADFKRRRAKFGGQLAMELGDERKKRRRRG